MNFSELGLTKRIVADVEALGFTEPTEIQQKAIPAVIAGKDVMASAETGSGKTAAYALPIIQSMKGGSERRPRALVLVPTRELALQVESQFERFANGCGLRTVTIYGGVGFEKQTRLLRRGVDVIVATPGRLYDHIERGNAELSNIQILVLDEADRMLDMGFTPQVRKIVETTPKVRQTIMFSATISRAVEQTANEFLKDPVTVRVNTNRVEPSSIEQKVFHIDEDGKDDLLVKLIKEGPDMTTVLVFAKTRRKATKICKRLRVAEVTADEIHGDISQAQRERTLTRYRAGEFSVLVATDIAARGLDIPAISHVVNYDLPMSAADYVHRIGRTGRAGRSGIAFSFVSADQRYLMREIEKVTGHAMDPNGPAMVPAHRRGGNSRPRGNNRNGVGSNHRTRTPFGGEQSSNSGGRTESRGSNARSASGAARGPENIFGGKRETRVEVRSERSGAPYGGNREDRPDYRSERSTPYGGNEFRSNRGSSGSYGANREGGGNREGGFNREGGSDFRSNRGSSGSYAGNRDSKPEIRSDRSSGGSYGGNREGRPDSPYRGRTGSSGTPRFGNTGPTRTSGSTSGSRAPRNYSEATVGGERSENNRSGGPQRKSFPRRRPD